MEKLSRAYISAIAAHAGYVTDMSDFDRDSIDLTVRGGDMSPAIGIQLKATGRIPTKATTFSFPLSVKNYNDLRGMTQTPRILVVFAMPSKETSWLNHSIQRLILRRCAYWKSLRGLPPTDNEETVSVALDLTQVLTVDSLQALMDRSRKGIAL